MGFWRRMKLDFIIDLTPYPGKNTSMWILPHQMTSVYNNIFISEFQNVGLHNLLSKPRSGLLCLFLQFLIRVDE